MKTVHITASRDYDVLIGSNILPELGSFAASMGHVQTACIVSDSNVWPLYGKTVTDILEQQGIHAISFVFPDGEASKNMDTYLNLLNHLARSQLTRTDLLVALGGGVVGDLTGFAAATYLRGIPYIQLPTTLLAAVDSSVGGKTAIDLPAGKNLAGAFYQPSLVLCDTDCLNTLPKDIYRDGCAEVIKYGVLYDKELFAHLLDRGLDFDREYVIHRCVELKRDAVEADEFDTGTRRLLNLGHTFGHAIESCSGYRISHGTAVAAGMAIAARGAAAMGICSQDTVNSIRDILNRFGLPDTAEYPANILADAALSDKKRTGSVLNLILPERIGCCRVEPVPISQILSFMEAGLSV